jgi:Mg-chelatase subunit ChlD
MNVSSFRLSNGAAIVRIRGEVAATAAPTRQPTNIIVVLDHSGSMQAQDKLRNVIRSLQFLIDYLKDTDAFSLITFSSDANVVYRAIPTTTENKALIRSTLSRIRVAHDTNISAAISSIHEVLGALAPADLTSYKHGVLFLTDGEATSGATSNEAILTFVTNLMARYPQLTITTIGYGDGHNAALLQAMAAQGGGAYDNVNTVEAVATVFGTVLGGLTTTLFQQVRVTVPPSATQLTKFGVRESETPLTVFLGDVLEGGETVAVFEGIADDSPLIIRGSSMATGVPVEQTYQIGLATPVEQTEGMSAYLRCQTVRLLDACLPFVERAATTEEQAGITSRCTELQTQLEALPPGDLRTVLLGEIARCRQLLVGPLTPPRLMRTISNTVAQHSAYLGTGRGNFSVDSEGPADPPAHPVLFMTASQQAASNDMYEHVSTPYPHGVSSNPTNSSSSSTTIQPPPGYVSSLSDDEDMPAGPPLLKRS